MVRGGTTAHTRNIENVYEIFLCMRYQRFNPCPYVGLLLLPYNARCAGGVPERAGGRDVGGRVVGYEFKALGTMSAN